MAEACSLLGDQAITKRLSVLHQDADLGLVVGLVGPPVDGLADATADNPSAVRLKVKAFAHGILPCERVIVV